MRCSPLWVVKRPNIPEDRTPQTGFKSMYVYGETVVELKINNILFCRIKNIIKFLRNFPFVYAPRRAHSSPKPDESIPTGLNLSRRKIS